METEAFRIRCHGLSQWDLLHHPHEIELSFEQQCFRRVLGEIERANRTCHPVRTLLEEVRFSYDAKGASPELDPTTQQSVRI
jgi:hypothetical protein